MKPKVFLYVGVGVGLVVWAIIFVNSFLMRNSTDAQLAQRLKGRIDAMYAANDQLIAENERLKDQLKVKSALLPEVPETVPGPNRPNATDRTRPTDLAGFSKDFKGIGVGILTEPSQGKILALLREARELGKPALDFLHDRLIKGEVTERLTALFLVKALLNSESVPYITQALERDPDTMVRRSAVFALEFVANTCGDMPSTTPSLSRAMTEDSDWRVRANAAYIVAQYGDPKGVDALINGYRQAPSEYRISFLEAISAVRSPAASSLLYEVVSSPTTDDFVKILALDGIKKMGDAKAIPVLQSLVSSGSTESLRIQAKAVIEELKKE